MSQILSDIITGFRTFSFSTWAQQLISPTPATQWHFMGLYLLLLLALLIGGIVVLFMRRLDSNLRERLANFLWSNLFIGLLIFFFRYQRIPYLGMDVFRFIHEIGIIYWINSIIWFYRTSYQSQQVQKIVIDRRSKYLPKSKRQSHT